VSCHVTSCGVMVENATYYDERGSSRRFPNFPSCLCTYPREKSSSEQSARPIKLLSNFVCDNELKQIVTGLASCEDDATLTLSLR
jgi:hypothetical protein